MIAAMAVSCNNKKANTDEANAEVVEAAKTILADDVLATLDELAQSFIDETGKFDFAAIISSALTEKEKLIKPDYLLEASQANEMVTKSQKLNALAVLLVERHIRIAYGMPTEETDEVMARFVAEVNDPVSFDDEKSLSPSEKAKIAYMAHKERGDIADYWQFALAIQVEVDYLISKNVDVVFRNLNEEQYASFTKKFKVVTDAVRTLAKYDSDVKQAWDAFNAGGEIITDLSKESMDLIMTNIDQESSIRTMNEYMEEHKDEFVDETYVGDVPTSYDFRKAVSGKKLF